MSQIILVTSGKGGTGKTTLCAHVGRSLAAAGQRVLLVEMDSGLRGLDLMLGVADRVVFDLSDLLCGRCKPADAVTVIPSAGDLHLIAAPVQRGFVPQPELLGRVLRGLAGFYDFLLLDGGAGLGPVLDICAKVSTRALVVAQVEPVCLRDAQQLVLLLDRLGLGQIGLVVNRFARRQLRAAGLASLDAVIDLAGAQLLGLIPEDRAVAAACAAGQPLAAGQVAARCMENIARRLQGQYVGILPAALR